MRKLIPKSRLKQKHTKSLCVLLSAVILLSSSNYTINQNHETKPLKEFNLNVINSNQNNIIGGDANDNILKKFSKHYIVKKEITTPDSKPKPKQIKNDNKGTLYKISAYDLSYQSTNKSRSNPDYGKTKSEFNLKGHTLASARTIAVDPRLIPLGSKVRLTFKDDRYKKYNSIYIARDIGGGINGKHIDLFVGDFNQSKPSKFAKTFGNTYAYVTILEE